MNRFMKSIEHAQYLNLTTYQLKFDECWNHMNSHFRKLETLSFYDEGNSSPYLDLLANDMSSFCSKLKNFRKLEAHSSEQAMSKNVKMDRLHILTFPLSPYLIYEYYSYYISSSLGETIRYIEKDKIKEEDLFDFVIFDKNHVFIQDYQEGILKGAWHISNILIIEQLCNLYDSIFNFSCDFRSMMKPDASLLDELTK